MKFDLELNDKTKKILDNAIDEPISVDEANYLINVQGQDLFGLLAAADKVRENVVGNKVTFINNCNLNFTNVCKVLCGFCAFGKSRNDPEAYILTDEEIIQKADSAVKTGAHEFTLMGGVLPEADIDYYEHLLKLLKDHYPNTMIHGFSPTMIYDAAQVSEMDIKEQLKDIKTQLRLSMNGAVSQSMREKGLVYKLNFGVELPRIKMIAESYEKNHDLAQALWKEDIRECKILAGMLQPIETFYPEIADIWVENIRNIEIAELTCMNLFQHLPYAPAKSFHWIADEQEYIQTCGFLTAARLLMKKGDMNERVENEFLDQAITAFLSGSYHVRNAAMTAIRRFMQQNEENSFQVCRRVEGMDNSSSDVEQLLYNLVKEEVC